MRPRVVNVEGRDREIARLIETLVSTEQQLEELTQGEVDSVASLDGRTLLLRRAQEETRQREAAKQASMLAELRVLFDLMPALIWFKDVDNNILRVNQKVADAAAMTVDQIEGRPSREIYPADSARFYADDLEVITSGIAKLGYEERMMTPGGQTTWVQTDKVPYCDQSGKVVGLVVVAKDITDSKHAESNLLFKEQRFRSLVEATAAIVWQMPPSGEFETDQPQWRAFTGQSTEELLGWGWLNAVHPDDRTETARLWSVAVSSRTTYAVEHRLRTKDHTYRQMMVRAVPVLSDEGSILQWIGAHNDISDLKRAEESLRLLASAVQQAKESIVITDANLDFPGPRIIFTNPAYTVMTGYSAEEALGSTPRITQGPRTDRSVLDRIRSDLLAGKLFQGEAINYRKDGREYLQEWQIAPLRNSQNEVTHYISTQRDITDRKESETALRQSEERFREVLENIDLIACIVNPSGIVTFCNNHLIKLTGWNRESILGSDWFSDFFGDLDKTATRAIFDSVSAEGIPAHYEMPILTKEGKTREIQWNSILLRDTVGNSLGIASIGEDVTLRNQAEAALKRSLAETERQVEERTADLAAANVELLRAVKQADAASRAKSEFLSSMSHELRTPMNSVLGYAQLLYLQNEDPNIKESARLIMQGGRHLLEMINEVLELARIESGTLAMSVEQVLFAEVLDQAVGLMKPIADKADVILDIDRKSFKKVNVQADRQRLLQVLINLLGNAIKFNRPGGTTAVRCCKAAAGSIRIEISDTGRGISPANQDLLFQPFQRFGDLGTEGTGLGLALSKRFMKLMSGDVSLAQSSPEGSTFALDLHRTELVVPAAENSANGKPGGNSLTDRHGSVLYIEDNSRNMNLVGAVLADYDDIVLIPAELGFMGVTLAQERHPDLILLDVHLPDIMGDEVLRRLKAEPDTAMIPVVILSADATQRQIDKLLGCGAEQYLTKPIDLVQLIEVFRRFLPSD